MRKGGGIGYPLLRPMKKLPCLLGRVNFQKNLFTTAKIEFLVKQMPKKKNWGVLRPIFPPPQFGFAYLNKLGTALIHVTQIEEGENWA